MSLALDYFTRHTLQLSDVTRVVVSLGAKTVDCRDKDGSNTLILWWWSNLDVANRLYTEDSKVNLASLIGPDYRTAKSLTIIMTDSSEAQHLKLCLEPDAIDDPAAAEAPIDNDALSTIPEEDEDIDTSFLCEERSHLEAPTVVVMAALCAPTMMGGKLCRVQR